MRRLTSSASIAVLAIALTVPAASGWFAADDPDQPTPTINAPDDDQERGGPPPWANAGGHEKKAKLGLEKWKQLTPAEKTALMKKLTAEHEAGMKAFAKCRAEGKNDCVKPLPPGHAKRQ